MKKKNTKSAKLRQKRDRIVRWEKDRENLYKSRRHYAFDVRAPLHADKHCQTNAPLKSRRPAQIKVWGVGVHKRCGGATRKGISEANVGARKGDDKGNVERQWVGEKSFCSREVFLCGAYASSIITRASDAYSCSQVPADIIRELLVPCSGERFSEEGERELRNFEKVILLL